MNAEMITLKVCQTSDSNSVKMPADTTLQPQSTAVTVVLVIIVM